MENKRLRKKLNTWLWWFLSILPFILLIFAFITAVINMRGVGSSWNDIVDYSNVFWDNDLFYHCFGWASDWSISSLKILFENLFITIGVSDNYDMLAIPFAWFVSLQLYHLIFDCVVFIFDWLHDFFERG